MDKLSQLVFPQKNKFKSAYDAADELFEDDKAIQEIIDKNAEIGKLIKFAIEKSQLGSSNYNRMLAEAIKQHWKDRTIRRTQSELIRLMSQPCFQIEIDAVQNRLRSELSSSHDESTKITITDALIQGFAITIVNGIDVTYKKELRSENGIAKHPRNDREVVRWSRSPCSIKIIRDDYLKLPQDGRELIKKLYKEYGLDGRELGDWERMERDESNAFGSESEPTTPLPAPPPKVVGPPVKMSDRAASVLAGKRRTKKQRKSKRKTKRRA